MGFTGAVRNSLLDVVALLQAKYYLLSSLGRHVVTLKPSGDMRSVLLIFTVPHYPLFSERS